MNLQLDDYSVIVSIAGGIGITPTCLLLDMFLDNERRQRYLPRLRRLIIVWAVKVVPHDIELIRAPFFPTGDRNTSIA